MEWYFIYNFSFFKTELNGKHDNAKNEKIPHDYDNQGCSTVVQQPAKHARQPR